MSDHEHTSSVYTKCRTCHSFGVNMPGDVTCGNCGMNDAILYRPPCCFDAALQRAERERDTLLRRVEAAETVAEAVYLWLLTKREDPAFQEYEDRLADATAAWRRSWRSASEGAGKMGDGGE